MNVLFTLMCVCRYKKNESAEEEAVRLAAWEKYLQADREKPAHKRAKMVAEKMINMVTTNNLYIRMNPHMLIIRLMIHLR